MFLEGLLKTFKLIKGIVSNAWESNSDSVAPSSQHSGFSCQWAGSRIHVCSDITTPSYGKKVYLRKSSARTSAGRIFSPHGHGFATSRRPQSHGRTQLALSPFYAVLTVGSILAG